MRGRVSSAFVLGLLFAAAARAQSGPDNDPAQAQGYSESFFHHSSFDSINQYNGQLTVPIRIGPEYTVGPNLRFQPTLVYNSRLQEPGHPTDENNPNYFPVTGDPALGVGWTFTAGKIACGALPTAPPEGSAPAKPCYMRPDGARIDFVGGPPNYTTQDGTQYELVRNGTAPSFSYTLWDGDGNRYDFTQVVQGYDDAAGVAPGYARDYGRGRDGYYLTSIRDPFGNALTVAYAADGVAPCPSTCTASPIPVGSMRCAGTSTASWVPSSFRIQRIGEASPTEVGQVVTDSLRKRISALRFLVASNGARQFAEWDLAYGTASLANRSPSLYCTTTLQTLVGISFPSDVSGPASYAFAYYSGTGAAVGLLRTMTLPTGATVYYDYGNYHFYHGRRALFSEADPCAMAPSPPPPTQGVRRSTILTDSGGPGHRRESEFAPETYRTNQGPCLPYADSRQYEQRIVGVVQRAVTGSDIPPAVTNYTQYSFPFGENGNSAAQTLTVAVLPPNADGLRRAETTLFWGSKGVVDPGDPPTPGDRLGADLRHASYESDPNPVFPTAITPPVCGGGAEEDKLCASHAIRVTQTLFQYEADAAALPDPDLDGTLRRPRSRTTYYGHVTASDPLAADLCPTCAKHAIVYGLTGANTWEGNGRHYNLETHSGNLGSDRAESSTVWTPERSTHLSNLYSGRIDSDPDIAPATGATDVRNAIDRSYFFDPATGFLRGSLTWDASTKRYFATCRYADAAGNAADEVTATVVAPGKPASDPCFDSLELWPSGVIGSNDDAFGQRSVYAGGRPASRRWLKDRNPLPWFSYRVDRDGATGWVASSYDVSGLSTDLRYDSLGRITSIAPPGEAPSVVSYPDPRTAIASRSGSDDFSWKEVLFDALGRLRREIRRMPSGYAFRAYAFDPAGHETFVSEWSTCASVAAGGDCLVASASSGSRFSSFDPFGRPQTITNADGSVTSFSFTDGAVPYSDTRKSVTTANVGCSWNGTVCAGGVASTTAYRYDASGRPVTVLEPGGDITSYAYDVAGRLVSVTQGSQQRTFSFDSFGNLLRQTTPEAGSVDATTTAGNVRYAAYGSLGNLRSRTEGWGSASPVTRSYRYDAAGRELCEIAGFFGPAQTCDSAGLGLYVRSFYDGDGSPGGIYALGKLTLREGYNRLPPPVWKVREQFAYSDPSGRLSNETTSVWNGSTLVSSASQGWTYDALGLVKSYAHPRAAGSFSVVHARAAGYPTGISAASQTVVASAEYDASGSLRSWTAGNGVATTITADALLSSRPGRIATSGALSTAAGGNFDSGVFRYDGAGNLVAQGSDVFGYDARSRVTSAAYAGIGTQSYAYDRYGNLLADGTTSFCPATCPGNRLPAPYAYDTRGNLIANGSAETLTYDDLSRQAREQGPGLDWRYLYSGSGERVAKIPTGGTAQYLYRDENGRIATEYVGSVLGRDNVFLGDVLVASFVSSGLAGAPGWQWYHSDHLGTPRLVTDANRRVVESRKYWPFGNGVPGNVGTLQKLRFSAMERDTEDNRYYDHARIHDAVLGRFASPDLLDGAEEDPQSWNRYAYASNNPLAYTDPSGLASSSSLVRREGPCAALPPPCESVTVSGDAGSAAQDQGDVVYDLLMRPFLSLVTGSENDPKRLAFDLGSIALLAAPLKAEVDLPPAVARTFARGFRVRVLRNPVVAYRFSTDSRRARGAYLITRQTLSRIGSPEAARRILNLPAGNTAETLTRWIIPEGTRVFIGRILDGAPEATQIFLENPSLLLPPR